jgi:hypothetical protein
MASNGSFVITLHAKQQKKGYFTLTHFDSEHKGDWKAKNAETNITRIEDDPS